MPHKTNQNVSQNSIQCENPSGHNMSGYNFLSFIAMLYMSIMLCNAILTNRYVGNDTFFVLGGTFTSPFIFILNDIIAEIFGYKITKSVILSGFMLQIVFTIICQVVLITPYPTFFKEQATYVYILGPSLLRITISGFIAYIIASLTNTYLITRWKILLKGQYFWLRSLGSSTCAEAIYSFLAILMMELNSIPLHNIFKVIIISYSIKALYSIIFAIPANWLVNYIKKWTGIDVYESSTGKSLWKNLTMKGSNHA